MQVIVNNKDTNNKTLKFEENFWSGKRTIVYDGIVLNKVKRNVYEYKSGNVTETFVVKGNDFLGIEIIMFDKNVSIIKKPTWYEIFLSILVFIPGVLFGAIGGAIGGALGISNLMIVKKVEKIYFKIIISLQFFLITLLISYIFTVLVFKTITFIF